jgi:hypothetical protein
MKRRILIVIFAGSFLFGMSVRQSLLGQTCNDDEGMVKSYVQGITDLVSKVKQESLDDFEKDYHEQSCLSRLTLSLGVIDSLIACLNKAALDTTATKEQIAAIKSKLQSYVKLKSTLEQDRNTLKAAKDAKTAKSIIEKFEIST